MSSQTPANEVPGQDTNMDNALPPVNEAPGEDTNMEDKLPPPFAQNPANEAPGGVVGIPPNPFGLPSFVPLIATSAVHAPAPFPQIQAAPVVPDPDIDVDMAIHLQEEMDHNESELRSLENQRLADQYMEDAERIRLTKVAEKATADENSDKERQTASPSPNDNQAAPPLPKEQTTVVDDETEELPLSSIGEENFNPSTLRRSQ